MPRRTSPAQLPLFAADTGSHFAGLHAAMYRQLADAYDRADAGQVAPLAPVAADLAGDAGDDSDDETSVEWRPSAETMRLFRAISISAKAAGQVVQVAAADADERDADERRYRAMAATQPATAAGNRAAEAALKAAEAIARDRAGQVAKPAKVAKPARQLWYVVDNAGQPLAGPMTKTAANAFMVERVRSHRAHGGTASREARIESFHYYHWSAKDERHADPNWPIYELRRRSAGHTRTVDTLTLAPATDAGPGEAPKTRHIIHGDGDETIESAGRPTYDYHRKHWHPRTV